MAKTYVIQPADGSYSTPGGAYYFKIVVPSTSTSASTMSTPVRLSDLRIPFDSHQPGEIRWSSITITFLRASDILAVCGDILDESKKDQIRLEIYRAGSLFWNGVIDWESIKKDSWYIDSGLKYRHLSISFMDALAYFSKNSVTLGEIGYSAYDPFSDVIGEMAVYLGMNSAAYELDPDWEITDPYAGNSYGLSEFYCINLSSSTLVSDFIQAIWKGMGLRIYILNGKITLHSRTGTTTTKAITNSYIKRLSAFVSDNRLSYVQISTGAIMMVAGSYSIAHQVTSGTESDIDDENLLYDDTTYLLGEIGTDSGDNGVAISSVIYTATESEIEDDTCPFTAELEYGDTIIFIGPAEEAGVTTPLLFLTTDVIYIHDVDLEPQDGTNYSVDYGKIVSGDGSGYRPKALPIANAAAAIWLAYHNYSEMISLTLRDFDEFIDLSRRFTFDSKSYAAHEARVNLIADEIIINLVRVA